MEHSSLLSIKNLTVKFGGLVALDDVFIDIKPNTVVGLIGPNGAGKTTLFNALSGLIAPDSGTLFYEGDQISWPKSHQLVKYKIARTLQGVGLFSGLTVIENVMMGADLHKKSFFLKDFFGLSSRNEAELRNRALDALAWAGALALADNDPAQLSYPDTKRVALARALVMKPKLLLLDEPAAGLGQSDIDALSNLIKQLKKETAILLVEHHVDFVSHISDQVYVLNFGKVIASGSFDQVKRDPAVLAAYLGTNVGAGADQIGGAT